MATRTNYELHLGESIETLKSMPDNSIDSVVTDPPYGLSFMGKAWDYDVPTVDMWREVLRVLKPGGHLLAFAGTRTQHRMAVAIEDAGFEIRDMIAWVYGSGFPKSLDVSKAIDKRGGNAHLTAVIGAALKAARKARGISMSEADRTYCGGVTLWSWYEGRPAGQQMPTAEVMAKVAADWPELQHYADLIAEAERDRIGQQAATRLAVAPGQDNDRSSTTLDITAPATPAAQQWAGWGTALKPSFESVTWASKPVDSTGYCAIIVENLIKLEGQCLQIANAAESSSRPTQAGLPEERAGSAQEPAATQHGGGQEKKTETGAADATSSPVDTSASTSAAASIAWSIASSWRHTLEGICASEKTSITETESSTTTDWRTLSCCLSQITPESIIQACSLPGGFSLNASTAAQIFNASLASLQSTLTLSAIDPATWQAVNVSQGEAVSPNLDPVVVARKPLVGTVAANVLQHGTGAINVDGCRVAMGTEYDPSKVQRQADNSTFQGKGAGHEQPTYNAAGRWPANLIHDGSDEVVGLFPEAGNGWKRNYGENDYLGKQYGGGVFGGGGYKGGSTYCDSGSAARFFYCAKASKKERGEGNNHPTVKPIALMAYLCRLVTPPGGTVLDPFMGSGSTGIAALREGFEFIGIEREPEYLAIAERRIANAVGE